MVEYTGEAVRSLSMDGRMTVCNMSIEGGARAGMIAADETTFEYLRGRPNAPQGDDFKAAVEAWSKLRTDDGAEFDELVEIDASSLEPMVSWGRIPAWCFRSPLACPILTPSPIPATARRRNARWSTWTSNRTRQSRTFR